MSVGSYRLNYGWKSFRIKKKGGSLTWRFWQGYFYRRNHRRIQNDSLYSDVTGSPFKMPTESPRNSKCQIRTVTCRFFCQNHRRHHRRKSRRWNHRKRLIYVSSADPPPLFLLLLRNPNSPHLQTTSPLSPPNNNLPHISTTSYISWTFMVTASVFWFIDEFYQFL